MFPRKNLQLINFIKFIFFLFFLFIGPASLCAMSSEEEGIFQEEEAIPPIFASIEKRHTEDKVSVKGSVKLRKFASHFTPSRFAKNRKPDADYDNTYQLLKAELFFQSQQVEWLETFITHGASSGILFRNEDKAQETFFESLKTVYEIELEFLPLLMEREGINVKEIEFLPKFLAKKPVFMRASQHVFEFLEMIFRQAKEDIGRKRFYFDQFSEEFKSGKDTTTEVRPDSKEKGSAETRMYTIEHVKPMIKQLFTQYQFFSKTLPIFQLMFEKQLFMGQKVKSFFTGSKKKKDFQQSYFSQTDKQESLRKTMEELLGDHKIIIGHLNSILYAHDENPIDANLTLFAAKVLGTHVFSLLGNLTKKQHGRPWSEEVTQEISAMETQFDDLLNKTSSLLSNPDFRDSKSKSVETLLSLGDSGKSLIMEKQKRKNKKRLPQFRRKLSQLPLENTDEKQDSSQDSKKDKKRKKRK